MKESNFSENLNQPQRFAQDFIFPKYAENGDRRLS